MFFAEGFGFDIRVTSSIDFEDDPFDFGRGGNGDTNGVGEERIDSDTRRTERSLPNIDCQDAVEGVGSNILVFVGRGDEVPSAIVLLEAIGMDVDIPR